MVGRLMYAGDHIVVERHGKAVAAMLPIEDYREYERLVRSRQQEPTEDTRQKKLL
jgi:antitoxin (DNA-binding transcriptional repressor) of toxin-antitoxin stability system